MNSPEEKFWRWLHKNDETIRKILKTGNAQSKAELKEHLDRKILDLGKFTWEISEGQVREFALTISPNRSVDLLYQTKALVAKAPHLAHWEWYPAKQANTSLLPFKIYDQNLDPFTVEPAIWEIKELNNEVNVKADQLKDLDKETQEHVLEIVIAAYFGEAYFIENIKKIVLE